MGRIRLASGFRWRSAIAIALTIVGVWFPVGAVSSFASTMPTFPSIVFGASANVDGTSQLTDVACNSIHLCVAACSALTRADVGIGAGWFSAWSG